MIYLLNEDGSLKAEVHDEDPRSLGNQPWTDVPPPPMRAGVLARFIDGSWQDSAAPEATAMSYQERRANEYPPVGEQLDMLWHAMNAGTAPKIEPFFSVVKGVKDRIPKQ